MIKYQEEFETYIRANCPGDKAAATLKSHLSSLNNVSRYLGISINAKILSTESDIDELADRLSKTGKLSPKNIKHYRTAMQQYVNMVNGE